MEMLSLRVTLISPTNSTVRRQVLLSKCAQCSPSKIGGHLGVYQLISGGWLESSELPGTPERNGKAWWSIHKNIRAYVPVTSTM